MRSHKTARAMLTLSLGAATAAAVAGLAAPAQAAPAEQARAAAVGAWKSWTLQPGAAGVATSGKSRTISRNKAEVHVTAKDTAADRKGAYVWVVKYGTVAGSITKVKLNVAADNRYHTWTNMGGAGLRKVTVQECVDNTWTWEICSPVKTVWTA
ncbi:hypothetical protein [Actinomadura macrotermitis]|uniref:Secreted protein n=1 Tax=Actinomadura macrotermitis TaxID=2585200 RepID=A0A7K0BUF7_9ACTN|nr:hypothetical protein [Actinomadura macrotermitis]MQY04828.1 hypothetical protein [Actinomadura macrotermitis]